MALHVFVFLLVVCLLLSLALLWRLDWFDLQPSFSRGGAKRGTLQRLLKPLSPHDCPACRLTSTASSRVGPAPLPVRPWSEMKSQRGAPKRVNTEGEAVPTSSAYTSALQTYTFMLWLAMVRMAMPSGSRPFAVRPAVPLSLPGVTLPCTV